MPYLAYIDPGSGTLLLQAVLAAALGSVFWVGNRLRRCFAGARRRVAAEKKTPEGAVTQ